MPTKEETRAQLRKFLEMCVKFDLEATGEHAIDKWEEYLEEAETEGFRDLYQLTGDNRAEMKSLIAEYRQTREQEDREREQRRLAEEHADEVLANHYADRIRRIVQPLRRPHPKDRPRQTEQVFPETENQTRAA